MTGNGGILPLAGDCLLVLPGVVCTVEFFFRLPFMRRLALIQSVSAKAVHVVRSSAISDHWKEKVLPRYARTLFVSSVMLLFFLMVLLCCFAGVLLAVSALIGKGPAWGLEKLTAFWVQIAALLTGMLYVFIRRRFLCQTSSDYSAASKLFHHLALSSPVTREMAFDMDGMFCPGAKTIRDETPEPPHVWVTGLAHSGTTLLLEALYASGEYTALTYRHMPFVLAPCLWTRITRYGKQKSRLKERAHKDRLQVGFDSPEAFEEVFWKTFMPGYIHDEHLSFHDTCEPQILEKYRQYVFRISALGRSETGASRYLAKNNNNVLRLPVIRAAFPDAVIIVPFRNPVDHAGSLLRQHRRFLSNHQEDPFALTYMNWLGHYEFGAGIRPFRLDPNEDARQPDLQDLLRIEYWIEYWQYVYDIILGRHSNEVLFFDYDRLCNAPKVSLSALAQATGMPEEQLLSFADRIQNATTHYDGALSPDVPQHIRQTHVSLMDIAVNAANNQYDK